MSGIVGIYNLHHQPVDSENLKRMVTAMAAWGPHGARTWNEGAIGLGHLMLRNTPESLHESLPMKSRCERYVITSHARIDNREELLKAFDIPAPEHPRTPDSALILEAYQKWGEECVHRLLGDWAFALWDKRERKLFIARDHHGVSGLYYYHGPQFFAFSPGLSGLLALPGVPRRLNEL
ncbi:MAG: asparagine synthetase B, partial [bacterium]|nr:asparagine synthetase B [bacterium]